MLNKNISEQIEVRMRELGLNIMSLEKMAGIKENGVGNILRGASKNPKIETLNSIAKVLGCKIDDLINPSSESTSKHEFLTKRLDLNLKLFSEITKFLEIELSHNYYRIINDDFFSLIKQSYYFCFDNNNGKINKEFIKWLISSKTQS